MDETVGFLERVMETLLQWASRALELMPVLLGSLAIVLLGWIAARIARGSAQQLGNYVNRVLDRTLKQGTLATARVSSGAFALLGEIAFWVVLLLSIVIAARVAGFQAMSVWLNRALVHVPNLLIGGLVVLIGYFVAARVGSQADRYPDSDAGRRRAFVARLAQLVILSAAVTIGLEQMGLDVTLLVVLIGVGLGTATVGLSIAFGLGARGFAAAIIGSRVAQRDLAPGMRVRIGDQTGDILEISATHLVIDTDQGTLLVPAGAVLAENILIHAPQHAPEDDNE